MLLDLGVNNPIELILRHHLVRVLSGDIPCALLRIIPFEGISTTLDATGDRALAGAPLESRFGACYRSLGLGLRLCWLYCLRMHISVAIEPLC